MKYFVIIRSILFFTIKNHTIYMKILYSGAGANKYGIHSVKEFLDIMNKHHNIECSDYIVDKDAVEKSEDCKEIKNMYQEENEYFNKYKKPMKTSKKRNKLYRKYIIGCKKYKKSTRKKCDLDKYLEFSGAEKKE